MHIDVRNILMQGEGAQEEYTISDESPELDDVTLAAPLSGNVRVMGTKEGVLAVGRLEADVELECNRCLRAFNHHVRFSLEAEFAEHPDEDQYPIDKRGRIDLTEPIRQDLVVYLPLQQLCQDDCNGIELKQKKDSNGSS
jgi:uncharacterized protein